MRKFNRSSKLSYKIFDTETSWNAVKSLPTNCVYKHKGEECFWRPLEYIFNRQRDSSAPPGAQKLKLAEEMLLTFYLILWIKKLSQRLFEVFSLAIDTILESLISNLCFRWACQAEKWKVKTLKSKFETSSNNEAAEFNKKVTDNISWKSSVSRTVPEYLKYSSVSTSRPSSESGFLFFSDLVLCK